MAMNFGLSSALPIAGAVAMWPMQYRQNREAGQGSTEALVRSGGNAAMMGALSMWGGMLLPLVPAAIKGAVKFGQQSSISTRGRSMPFSQRYEHTEAAAKMQSYGLSHMGEMSGAGSEASMYAGRYGRG